LHRNVALTTAKYANFKAPELLYRLTKDFWDKNHDNAKAEQWGVSKTT